ncbi:hypothetical protein ED733_003824 [Metarhizium rileyi]|uniref:CRIB domain-containing protein n=1 Tax=Metarhizium rileyi (strain RCEF 4871) TaxID=1649241 RepID=A0A5C6GBR0_METRR|nr:hypothetical protein ED733_003824 [Metarhizium rileyi]
MSLYSGHHDAVPTQAPKRNTKLAKTPRPSASTLQSNPPLDSPSMEQLSSASIADFLGPAVDKPPSPQKLRLLNKQMKRASQIQRHHGHKTASSESSSSSSMNISDRLPWELALDNLSLVRRSSLRSNDSSIPSRDRPESIHHFGKSLFHRRGKSKRESSAQRLSASSIYSGDAPAENSGSGSREGIIPSIFSRRKQSRDEFAPRRPRISGPFNFQHVAHTQRDDVTKDDAPSNGTQTWNSTTLAGVLEAPSPRPRNLPESMFDMYQGQVCGAVSRPPLVPRHTAPASGPRRLPQHTRSQEQLRKNLSQPPPRPPRSPIQVKGFSSPGPLPPPRVSSRQSSYQDITDAIHLNAAARAQTSKELCKPLPFGSATCSKHVVDAFDSHEHYWSAEIPERSSPDERRYTRDVLGARNSSWPLAISTPLSCETLSDVPEEDEQHGTSKRSRLSLASNNSSLRGSQSVPMLRSLIESQRPTSGASETLGCRGIMGLCSLVYDDPRSPVDSGTPTRESWEDLIDYCYEHEAEADCDYQWDRPSLDTPRDSVTPPAKVSAQGNSALELESNGVMLLADSRIFPSQDAPSLSPASYRSTLAEHEVITPNSAFANNFSLPRSDRKSPRPPMKDTSRVSGFTLSPSLFVHPDYQQQMFLSEGERLAYSDYELIEATCHQSAFQDDVASSVGTYRTSPFVDQRSSTSTTATNSTSRSNSIGRQYRSTNSSWTTFARRTASTTSLNKMAAALTDGSEPLPLGQLSEPDHGGPEWTGTHPVAQDSVPDMVPISFSTNGSKKHFHKSHASEPQVLRRIPPQSPVEGGRQRARTTSFTAQSPPPVGQYALFPRTQFKATEDHI